MASSTLKRNIARYNGSDTGASSTTTIQFPKRNYTGYQLMCGTKAIICFVKNATTIEVGVSDDSTVTVTANGDYNFTITNRNIEYYTVPYFLY